MTTSTSTLKQMWLFALCTGALLLTGCPLALTPEPLAPMPRVLAFTSSAAEVAVGGKVTLGWRVEDATEVKVEQLSVGVLPGVEGLEGTVEAKVDSNSVFVLTARNARGAMDSAVVTVRVRGEASGLLFVASTRAIEVGQAVTLAWSAPGASAVTVTAAPGGSLDLSGQIQSGSVVVRPTAATRYTIDAGGQTATLEVEVSGRIVQFTASPTAALAGATVNLSWATANADRVQLLTPGRAPLVDTTDAAMMAAGTFDEVLPSVVDPDQYFTYELRVTTGALTLTRVVRVGIEGKPAIVSFTAPALAKRGTEITLSWLTLETDSVSISANGVEIFRSPGRALALSGSTTLPTPAIDTTYVLTATNARGGSVTRTSVVDSLGLPSVTLTAAPRTLQGGDQVTLSWTGQDLRNVTISNSTTGLALTRRGVLDTGSTTVRVNGTATFTLTADNGLGDTASSTDSVTVTAPVTLSVAQSGDLRLGQAVSVTASRPGDLIGLPHQTVAVRPSSTGFVDISVTGTRLLFPGSGNLVANIDTSFRTVLFGRTVGEHIRVSRFGYLVFGEYVNGGGNLSRDTGNWPSTKLEPMAVAPYWDSLSTPVVYWELRGAGGASVLVVQWSSPSSNVNAQAKISSTGQIDFEYGLLPAGAPQGRVGVTGPTLSASVIPTVAPAVDTGFTFFGPMSQPVQVPVYETGRISGSVELSAGESVRAEGSVTGTVVFPDELALTEALPRTSLGVNGQWLELTNWRQSPIDLNGWSLTFADGGTAPLTTTIPARSTLVLGATTDSSLNDDAGVQVAVPGFDIAGPTVALTRGGVHQSLNFTDGGLPDAGTSFTFDPGPFRYPAGSLQGAISCLGTRSYGSLAQRGSPGSDRGCGFPYAKSTIPEGYLDIADPALALSFVGEDDGVVSKSLVAAPVPFFGVAQTSMLVSINGYLSFDEGSVVANQYFIANVPATADTNSVLAVFADDLQLNRATFSDSNVYVRRLAQGEDPFAAAPHWIVQWHHVSHVQLTVASRDDFNFQVKLFDDGAIEYHFAELRSLDVNQYSSGNSAVTWLEAPGGTSALVINANTSSPGISPHTAIRFTPRGSP